jgi:hypothetical protein
MINSVDLLTLFRLVSVAGPTWHNPNPLVLVEGAAIALRPLGACHGERGKHVFGSTLASADRSVHVGFAEV